MTLPGVCAVSALTLGNGFPADPAVDIDVIRDRQVPYPETGLLPGQGVQIDQICTAANLYLTLTWEPRGSATGTIPQANGDLERFAGFTIAAGRAPRNARRVVSGA